MKLQQLHEEDWKVPRPWDHSRETLYDLEHLDWPPTDEIRDIRVDHNFLISLDGVPTKIPGKFQCNNNNLRNLVGGPTYVGGDYRAQDNKLTSMKGAPKHAGSLHLDANDLTEIDEVLEYIGGTLDLNDNKIKSLKGIHKKIKHCGELLLAGNPIEEAVLGVLLIPGLQSVNMNIASLEQELNDFLPNTRGMAAVLECQDILLEKYKGKFDRFAVL